MHPSSLFAPENIEYEDAAIFGGLEIDLARMQATEMLAHPNAQRQGY